MRGNVTLARIHSTMKFIPRTYSLTRWNFSMKTPLQRSFTFAKALILHELSKLQLHNIGSAAAGEASGLMALPRGAAGLVQRVVRDVHVGDAPAAAMRCVLVAP